MGRWVTSWGDIKKNWLRYLWRNIISHQVPFPLNLSYKVVYKPMQSWSFFLLQTILDPSHALSLYQHFLTHRPLHKYLRAKHVINTCAIKVFLVSCVCGLGMQPMQWHKTCKYLVGWTQYGGVSAWRNCDFWRWLIFANGINFSSNMCIFVLFFFEGKVGLQPHPRIIITNPSFSLLHKTKP